MPDKLTPQQALAVHNRGGNLLVSAAAGSGKTKVLVDRLLTYLTDPENPADLDSFLIITYTKAAAAELRGKIASKLTEQIAAEPENRHLQKQMQRLYLTKISTVHGFCGDILREYVYKLDLSADFRAFVDTQGLGRDDRLVPELILKVYDSAKCHLDPNGWLEQCVQDSGAACAEDVSQTVWGAFLMEDLRTYLDLQIAAFMQCVQAADDTDGFDKPAMNLRETLVQLQQMRGFNRWDEVVRHNKIDYGRLVFPKKNPDPELTDQIKAVRNACKKGLEKKLGSFQNESDQLLQDLQQCAAGTRGLVSLVRWFDEEYTRAKKRRRILDFSDLEHKMLDLLVGKYRNTTTAAAREIGGRFREIMVDEYQDSNSVQDAIFRVLTEERRNCFMVGDVKQSIYQFRLADPGIFLEKYHSFLPVEDAESGDDRKVLLSHNFRSGPEVISAVNDVFSCCMTRDIGGLNYGEAEALREGIPHISLGEPAVEFHALEIREDTYAEEAAYVAQQIQNMLTRGTKVRCGEELRPVKPEDIVILLRSPGSVGAQYQRALEERGIRCSSGGGKNLLETEEIATLYSFLQIIVNPRQDIPLISALASPLFGFTADDLAQIRARQKKGSFYDALLESRLPKAETFLDILLKLRKDARRNSLTHLLERCFVLTRIDSIFGSMQGGEAKQSNLQTFFQLAVDYEQGNLRDLSQFLQHLDSLQGRGLISAGSVSSGAVTIMSIHKSKGLEFPVVFLCGLSRSFNRESLYAQILCDKDLGLGLSVADPLSRIRYPSVAKRAIMVKALGESLSEEMRVLYVAMTRARDRLIMTYSGRNLEGNLQTLVSRMYFDSGKLISREAICPGEWILLEVLQRMEAGELHSLGGRPQKLHSSPYPWKITLASPPETEISDSVDCVGLAVMPEDAEMILSAGLSFQYGYLTATRAPSKQTATDRKGRFKDAEAAELTVEQPRIRNWRHPSFLSETKDPKAYGNAVHGAMQYIRYENCSDENQVRQEISRMTKEGFLSEEQANLLDSRMIAAFFQTEPGRKLSEGAQCLREFKFSILDDGIHYDESLQGEQVLLQGVVDCALIEEDGITIIDFKTDRVTDDTLMSALEQYRPQVETYAHALARIYECRIKDCYLYFFRMDKLVKV